MDIGASLLNSERLSSTHMNYVHQITLRYPTFKDMHVLHLHDLTMLNSERFNSTQESSVEYQITIGYSTQRETVLDKIVFEI